MDRCLIILTLALVAILGTTASVESACAKDLTGQVRVGMTILDLRGSATPSTCRQAKTKNKIRTTLAEKHLFEFRIFAEGHVGGRLHLYLVHEDNGTEIASAYYLGQVKSQPLAYPQEPIRLQKHDSENEHIYTVILSQKAREKLHDETLKREDWLALKEDLNNEKSLVEHDTRISDDVAAVIPIAGNTRGVITKWPECLESVDLEPFDTLYKRTYRFKYIAPDK